ncbi:MAG: hypothetical protein WAN06_20165 [Candidatus Sulfotelmatobacter sp.]
MRHEKTVTDAVRRANRGNAQSSTGPRTKRGKAHSRHNALRHGILARNVILDTHEKRAEYRALRRYCKTELHPRGLIEKFIVEEIATLFWKLAITERLEIQELMRRQELSDGLGSDGLDHIFNKSLELPISASDLPLARGWDCERMVVRALAGQDRCGSNATSGPEVVGGQVVNAFKTSQNNNHQQVDHLEIEAVMGSALETLTRYQTKLKRDLYRAIETLHKMQAERREGESDASQ